MDHHHSPENIFIYGVIGLLLLLYFILTAENAEEAQRNP